MASGMHEAVIRRNGPFLGQGHALAIGHDVIGIAQDHNDPRRIERQRADRLQQRRPILRLGARPARLVQGLGDAEGRRQAAGEADRQESRRWP